MCIRDRLNGDPVDALSMIVFRDNAYAKGRRICEKLRDNIPRNLFEDVYKRQLQRASRE